MTLKLLWILCPILVYILFLKDKSIKAIFTVSLSCALLYVLPLCFGVSYKYDFFHFFGFTAVYLSFLIVYCYGFKKIGNKKKGARIALKVLFFYPILAIFTVLSFLIIFIFGIGESTDETFHRGEYTVERSVEWNDNMKEYGAITIYQNEKNAPFLQHKIYEEKDYNTYIERVSYNEQDTTMILILYRGWEVNKRSWKVVVDLNTGQEIK